MFTALLYSQDKDETAVLSIVLRQAGFSVQYVQLGSPFPLDDPSRPIRLIVVAATGPQTIEDVRTIQRDSHISTVLITENMLETDQCRLLETSVDMIVNRPYSSRLLISKIRALTRIIEGSIVQSNLPALHFPGLTIEPATRTVVPENSPAKRLTHLEFQLLYTLLVYRGQVVPTEKIIETVWGYTSQGDHQLVRGLVSRVRKKIERDPKNPNFISTVPGIGYIFEVNEK